MPTRSLNALILIALCGLALGNGGEIKLPPAKSGQKYEANLTEVLRQNHFRIESDAASPRLRWSMDPKGAPAGLNLLPNGILTGTPRVAQRQTYRLMVQIRDESLGADSLSLQFLLTVERPRLRLVQTAPRLVPLGKPQQSSGTASALAAPAAIQSSGGSAQTAPSGPFKVTLDTPAENAEKLSLHITPAPTSKPEVRIWVDESSVDASTAFEKKTTCPTGKIPQSFKDFIMAVDPKPPVPSGSHKQRQKPGTLDPDKKPGQFSVELFRALGACDAVFAQVIIDGTTVSSPPVLVKPLKRPKTPVVQTEDLLEGKKSVSGSTSKGASVEISVNGHVNKTATADKTTGKFKIDLDKALKAGDKVVAKATQNGASVKSEAKTVLMKPLLDAEGLVEEDDNKGVSGSAPKGAEIAVEVNDKLQKTTTADATTGKFSIELAEPLKAGDKVVAKATKNGVPVESEPIVVRLKTDLFGNDLVEGRDTVSGIASAGAKITIEVNGELKDETATADTTTGKFSIKLGKALQAGNKVVAKATKNGVTIESEPIIVRSLTLDLGRTRAFFSTGVILSKENEDFSEQDPFLGFNLVSNWWRSKPRVWDSRNDLNLEMSRFWFHTFTDVLLTSIPVETEKEMEMEMMEIPGDPPMDGGMLRLQDNGDMPDALDTFLSSRKSALIQGGFYLPIVTTVWTSPNPNAFFIAPIVKVGIQTTTEEDGMEMMLDPPDPIPPPMGPMGTPPDPPDPMDSMDLKPTLGTDDVFNFFSFGLRLGHWDLTDLLSETPNKIARGRSPQLLTHLDLMFGRWENFEVMELNDDDQLIRRRPWRFAIEGRLKIPSVPFFVGMDANLSMSKGKDDVRFVFGTKFDIAALFKKLSIPK